MLRGSGGGGSPCFFVKLDFEIAVDQQTKAHDRNHFFLNCFLKVFEAW